jgi:hypothetical protein
MTVVAIASVLAGLFLMASRLFATSKPLWAYLPPRARVWLPVVVMALPQFAEVAATAKKPEDLANLLILIPAVVLPGAKARDMDGDGIPDDEEA